MSVCRNCTSYCNVEVVKGSKSRHLKNRTVLLSVATKGTGYVMRKIHRDPLGCTHICFIVHVRQSSITGRVEFQRAFKLTFPSGMTVRWLGEWDLVFGNITSKQGWRRPALTRVRLSILLRSWFSTRWLKRNHCWKPPGSCICSCISYQYFE